MNTQTTDQQIDRDLMEAESILFELDRMQLPLIEVREISAGDWVAALLNWNRGRGQARVVSAWEGEQ